MVEAKACTRKYFTAASEKKGDNLVVIKGIKEIKFNSNPSQAPNQEVDEIDKKVPINSVEKNNK